MNTEEIWCMEQRTGVHPTEYGGHSERIEDHAFAVKEVQEIDTYLDPTSVNLQHGEFDLDNY